MKHYLFIGGPWDGNWEEAPGCDFVNLAKHPNLTYILPIKTDATVKVDMEIYTYTLRRISTSLACDEVYVEASISDRYLLTKLLSACTRT